MNEEFTPHLTLDPNAAAAAAQAPAAPTLTLSGETEEAGQQAPAERLELDRLTPQEQEAVRQFSRQIDVQNSELVLNYGAAAQKNIADFSESALESVRTKDLGEIGGMLSDLVVELKGLNFDEEEKRGFKGLFKRASNNLAALKAQYDKAEVNVDKITGMLEQHERTLLKDISMMDKMYDRNQAYFKELTMYIIAG